MQWTSDCTKALASTKERGDTKALKSLKKKQASLLSFRVVLVVLTFFCRPLRRLSGPFGFVPRSLGEERGGLLSWSGAYLLPHFFFMFPSRSLYSRPLICCHGQLNIVIALPLSLVLMTVLSQSIMNILFKFRHLVYRFPCWTSFRRWLEVTWPRFSDRRS